MAQFEKGRSGNPGGRPKEDPELKALARAHTATAVETLVEIMKGKRSPAAARVSAAQALLDRGYGKPPQTVDSTLILQHQDVSANPLSPAEWDKQFAKPPHEPLAS